MIHKPRLPLFPVFFDNGSQVKRFKDVYYRWRILREKCLLCIRTPPQRGGLFRRNSYLGATLYSPTLYPAQHEETLPHRHLRIQWGALGQIVRQTFLGTGGWTPTPDKVLTQSVSFARHFIIGRIFHRNFPPVPTYYNFSPSPSSTTCWGKLPMGGNTGFDPGETRWVWIVVLRIKFHFACISFPSLIKPQKNPVSYADQGPNEKH